MNFENKKINENLYEIYAYAGLVGTVEKIDGLWYWNTDKETSIAFTNFTDARLDLIAKNRDRILTYDPMTEIRHGIDKYKKDDGFKHPYKKD